MQVWQMADIWSEVNHAFHVTDLAIETIFFLNKRNYFFCYKIYRSNMLSVWQPFDGVYGSSVTLNFGRMRMNFVPT